MDEYQSLSHTMWDCKYHVVWIPKCRRKVLFEQLRRNLGQVFRELARQRESDILEGHLMPTMLSHAHLDSTEILSCSGGGLHQGKECHPHCEDFPWEKEELHWLQLLG